ncbi:hypothetical protein WDW37_13150 [Bdellovibrionota bacterium FG-1]
MRLRFIGLALLCVMSGSVWALEPALPQVGPSTGDGKGTIGLVCMDSFGQAHFWNSKRKVETRDTGEDQTDFEVCIDEVVEKMQISPEATCQSEVLMSSEFTLSAKSKLSRDSAEMTRMIHGFSTFRRILDGTVNRSRF